MDQWKGSLTGINIRHHNLRALIREQLRCLGANALPGPGDDGDLPGQQPFREIEVASDLAHAVGGRHGAGNGWRTLWLVRVNHSMAFWPMQLWKPERGGFKLFNCTSATVRAGGEVVVAGTGIAWI